MTISCIAATSATSGASAVSSLALTYPTLAANDVLIAQVHIASSSATITTPAGWTLIRSDTGNNRRSSLYWKLATGAESGTVAFSLSASVNAVGGMASFRGVDTTTPVDASAGQTNGSASTSCTCPTVTASASGGMLLTFSSGVGNVTFTPNAGQTERYDVTTTAGSSNCAAELATEALASSGATGTRASTMSGSVTSMGQSVILLAAVTAWHITTATRKDVDRIKRATIAATSGEGFLSLSTDNSTWSYFAGPATGTVLTAVASLAAAQAAPVALPTNGYWDLPSLTEARVIRLHHRSTGTSPYTIYEYYPRRMVQSDDIEAEAIKAIHIAAGAITADKLSVITLSAITASTGDLSVSGALTIGASGKLRTSADETVIDSTGMSLAMPSAYSDPAAIKFKDGATLHGFLVGNKADANTVSVALGTNSTLTNQSTTIRALNTGVGNAAVTTQVNSGAAQVQLLASDSATATATLTNSGLTVNKGLNVGTATGAATGAIKASSNVEFGGLMGVGGTTLVAGIRARIKGIGTTSATYGLQVDNSSDVTNLQIRDDGVGTLRAASWTYTSDASQKRNIKAYDKAKANVNALKAIAVKQFDYIDGLTNQVGYTAQELQAVLPDAVTTLEDGTLAVRSLEPWIVLWVQQHQTTIEAQQQQIDALAQQVQALQAAVEKLAKGKP